MLDLGCGAGRHTILFAEQGFDVYACDSSPAMVSRTRQRVTGILGREEAHQRVRHSAMEDLHEFASTSFHLVVACAVYHHATTRQQWEWALTETARVLMHNGQLYVANFSPRFSPQEDSLFGRMSVFEAEDLDAEMARYGLFPVRLTETVTHGWRVTVHGFYRKQTPVPE